MAVIQQFLNFGFLNRFFAPIQATGGTIIDEGGYRIHVFTSTGPFNVSFALSPSTVDYLVVAGGGGGAGYGGGGAGGLRTGSGFPITIQDYTITVGQGGNWFNLRGGDSTFSTITSTGGGRDRFGAYPGGSGGGGHIPFQDGGTGNTPPVSPPQGNPGGNGGNVTGGGGGGAGGAGLPGATGGNGGDGVPISWVPASYGTPGPAPGRWFAGGGGGGGGGVSAPGGAGGGGDAGFPGTANTGGGGGALMGLIQNEGSGIVIIRYSL